MSSSDFGVCEVYHGPTMHFSRCADGRGTGRRPSVSGVAAVSAGVLPRLPQHHGEPLFVSGPVSSN